MNDQTPTLRLCFEEAEAKRKTLENAFDSNGAEFQENLTFAIDKYEECVKIAAQVSLFSPNETLEDMASGDLQYFLPYYYIGELLLRLNAEQRGSNLKRSRSKLEQYLKQLDTYDILVREDARIYERYQDNPDAFSTASTTDAAARRHTKITRFKEEKAMKQKLEHLRKDPTALQNDDTALRDLHLTNISFCTHQAFQTLESIAQELQILALAPPIPADPIDPATDDERQRDNSRSNNGYSDRLDGSLAQLLANNRGGPILSKDGRPLRPFTLTDSRQRLQQGVFRPDHNLPSMSIDEYLEEEKKRGGIIEGGGAQSGIKPYVDEDDVDIADQETMKARAWDDYKDANPRGAGNTMNMG